MPAYHIKYGMIGLFLGGIFRTALGAFYCMVTNWVVPIRSDFNFVRGGRVSFE